MSRNVREEPLRIGILGCGAFAQRRLLTCLNQTPEVKVISIQKRDADEARVVARRFGVPRSYSSREEMLADPELEAVFICTANQCHEEDAIACAQAGKDTICEKPLSVNSESVRRMIHAFQEADRQLLVGHSCRFKPAVRKAREYVRDGRLGQVRAIRGFFNIIPPQYNWRHQRENAGGAVYDVGVHVIDFFRFVLGQEIVSVLAAADVDTMRGEGRADNSARIIVRMESGVLGEINVSFDQFPRNGFEVVGDKALLQGWMTFRQSNEPGESLRLCSEVGFSEVPLNQANIYVEELRHVANVFANGEPTILGSEVGLANQRVLDAVFRSIEEKREIAVETAD